MAWDQWGVAGRDIVLWAPKIKRHSVFERKPAPDLIRGGLPVRVTKTRRIKTGSGPVWVRSAAQHPADDARGIINRRDHPGIIQPRWPDHAENTDDMTRGIAVGRDDRGRAGQRKQLVFRSDENPHAFGAFRASQ